MHITYIFVCSNEVYIKNIYICIIYIYIYIYIYIIYNDITLEYIKKNQILLT